MPTPNLLSPTPLPSPTLDFSESLLESPPLLHKYQALKSQLASMTQVLIGFSGGVDSTLLTAVARHVLGKDCVHVYLAVGPSLAKQEQFEAQQLAEWMDVRLTEYAATEFENPAYLSNGPDRCFHCKTDLFLHLKKFASDIPNASILYGGNLDDTFDYRPGRRAAFQHGALAPMAEVGLSKLEVRSLSRSFGLPTADKPAQPCLSSRIPYGSPVDAEKLAMVEAGEILLANLGFREFRLRHFGDTARIEVPVDQKMILDNADCARNLLQNLRDLGFSNMHIDPRGFRSGSLNEALSVTSISGPVNA